MNAARHVRRRRDSGSGKAVATAVAVRRGGRAEEHVEQHVEEHTGVRVDDRVDQGVEELLDERVEELLDERVEELLDDGLERGGMVKVWRSRAPLSRRPCRRGGGACFSPRAARICFARWCP